MIHRRSGDSTEPVRTFAHQANYAHRRRIIIGLKLKSIDLMEEPIQMLPHIRADRLAHLPRIFPSPADTLHNRKRSFGIGDQKKKRPLWVNIARGRTGSQR